MEQANQGHYTMKPDNIIEGIFTLMQKDNEDPQSQSEQLELMYDTANEMEKKAIDHVLICICGYSLDTLINNPEEISFGEWK